MKRITQLFMTMTLVICFTVAKGQVNYTDFSPDLTFQVATGAFGNFPVDFDGDNIDDAKFDYYNYPSFGIWNIGLRPIDTNNPKVELLYDNSVNASPIGDFYVKMLSASDPINQSGNYSSTYPQLGDIYNQNFLGAGAKYIGYRLIIAPGTYKYGWMLVELSGSGAMTLTIKELGYENTNNTAVKAGEGGTVGISDLKLEGLQIDFYPNPTKDYLNITTQDKSVNGAKASVYTIEGKLISEFDYQNFPMEIDLTRLNAGVYFLEVAGQKTMTTKKFIKY